MSHLLQMRGLKQERDYLKSHPFESHLLQMRGLKHTGVILNDNIQMSRIFYRCVD